MSAKVLWYGAQFHKLVDAHIRKELTRIAFEYERNLQASFREKKTGLIYRIGRTRRHRASSPGESPAIMFATLTKSVRFEISKLGPLVYRLVIGSTLEKIPAWLEFGTRFMKPRPAWRPTYDGMRRKLRLKPMRNAKG